MPKWEACHGKKEGFALYLLQIKRFRRSGKIIGNGSPNGIKKASKLKPLASNVKKIEILMDFGKLGFLIFFGLAKIRPQNTKIRFLAKGKVQADKLEDPVIIQVGPLSSGSGCFSWH